MAENKTKATGASVSECIQSRAKGMQQEDCETLIKLMQKATGHEPHMWGPSIVGFGSYTYRYASGHGGEAPLVGFAIRGREIVLYTMSPDGKDENLLAQLGPHRSSKACIYIRNLQDIDQKVLKKLIDHSVRYAKSLHTVE